MRFDKLHKELVVKAGIDDRMALLAVAQARALATPLAVEELLQGAVQNGRELIRDDPVGAEIMLADEPFYPSAIGLFWRKIIDAGFDWTAATPQERVQVRDECARSLIPDLAPMTLERLGSEERLPPTGRVTSASS